MCLALLVTFLPAFTATPAVAQTALERRVTALPARRLLTTAPGQLVDAHRQHVAVRFRTYAHDLYAAWALSQILAFAFIWSAGYGARLRDAVTRRVPHPFAMRFVYGALLSLLGLAAAMPAAYARWRVDVAFGVTRLTAANWVHDGLVGAAVEAIVVGAIVASIFALVDRTRIWWAFASAGLFVVTLLLAVAEPIVVAPLYERFHPLPRQAPIRAPLQRLARRAGIVNAPIVVSNTSRSSSAITADIAGFGPTKRIVLGDLLLREATPSEVLFLAAREFGHYAHADDFRLSLFWTFLFILATALAVVIADRIRFRRDDDSLARLALVFSLMGAIGLVLVPIYNGYSRNNESRADAYALSLTHDRVAAVRAYVRIADETLAPLCPSRLIRLYFYNSPPLGTRIAKVDGRYNPCP